jgi:ABC-type branched-subunit amino acid transport system ATPase component/ABC-type branched-subunit amino acid transport system permease subunit
MLQQLDYWNQIIIFAIFAMSLNLVQGYTGQLTVAQAAFGAVGGYSAALLSVHLGLPFLVGALVGMVLGFVIGILLSIPALGVGANYVILLTLAFAYIASDLLASLNVFGGATGILGVGNLSLFGLQLTSQYSIFFLFLGIGLLVFGFCWRVGESGYGRILKGMREDESAVRSLGKNTLVYQALVFGLGSALAGLAGAMFTFYFGNATPSEFNLNEAILFVIMVVIGGAGNLFGSVVGAILITASTPVLEDWVNVSPSTATYWQQVVYAVALILVMIFRPAGLFPEHTAGQPYWWQRLAALGRAGAGTPQPALAQAVPAVGATGAAGTARAAFTAPVAPLTVSRVGAAGDASEHEPGEPVPGPRLAAGGPGPVLADDAPDEPLLEVRDLVKSFGGIQAVRGVTLQVPARKVTALIGPNGAGKSTLFGLFTGFIPADSGSVKLKGVEIRGKSPDAIASMGMVRSFQDVRLFRYMTCLQNVMLAVPGQDCEHMWRLFATPLAVRRTEKATRDRAMEILRWVGMSHRANDLAGSLGHGEQKLVAIARVLATEADLLLLDEPTSGVDPEWVERVAEVIRELPARGRTVCVVEHNLGFLQLLNAGCYFMEAGLIKTHGPLEELMADEELRRAYFGV